MARDAKIKYLMTVSIQAVISQSKEGGGNGRNLQTTAKSNVFNPSLQEYYYEGR
jgi:hypothetical protein